MGSSIANKVFIFTLILIVSFLFIWTGGLNTFTHLLDTVTSNEDSYSASLPASEDMILHGALFTFTLYLAYNVAASPGKKIDKISSEIIFNINNLIIPIELPKNLVSPKNKKPEKIISKSDKKITADESRHINSNNLSEYEKAILEENEKESGINGKMLKSVRRKVNISEMVYGATKVSTPPPYVTSFLSSKTKTRYVENFNRENEKMNLKSRFNKQVQSNSKTEAFVNSARESTHASSNLNKDTSTKYNPMMDILGKSKNTKQVKPENEDSEIKSKIKVDPMAQFKKAMYSKEENNDKPKKETNTDDRPSQSSSSYFD